MKEFVFNKGIDYWNASYYPNLGPCFLDREIANSFGSYFCDEIDQPKYLEKLCDSVYETIKNNRALFSMINKDELVEYCFDKTGVTYNEDQQYIRFPDFKLEKLNNYVIRMDINPCIGRKDAMTKIYCIPRFKGAISIDKLSEFVLGARAISEKVLEFLVEKYIQIYNQFAEKNSDYCNKIEIHSDEAKLKIKVISLCVGSDTKETSIFLKNIEKPSTWKKYSKKDKTAQSIFEALKVLNSSTLSKWELNDYSWYSQQVVISEKKGESISLGKKVSGYLGFVKEENIEQYLGVVNSIPRDLMLPIHLNLIRTDLKHFYG